MAFHWRANHGPLIVSKLDPPLTKLSGSTHTSAGSGAYAQTRLSLRCSLKNLVHLPTYRQNHEPMWDKTNSLTFRLAITTDPIWCYDPEQPELIRVFAVCTKKALIARKEVYRGFKHVFRTFSHTRLDHYTF